METPVTGSDDDQKLQAALGAFAKQIGWCESLGSPFTARGVSPTRLAVIG
jgi:hypothetical protein